MLMRDPCAACADNHSLGACQSCVCVWMWKR